MKNEACINYLESKNDSLKISARLRSFNEELTILFHPNSRARLWLISSIKKNIKAYGLAHKVDAWDILSEAYTRAVKFITDGGIIWNPISWLKTASVFIIHEQRRKLNWNNTISIPEMDWFEDNFEEEIQDIEFISYQLHLAPQLHQALESLTQMERNLLFWREIDQFSWKKIQQILISRGESASSLVALRKRKERAFKKLRKAFLLVRRVKINDLSRQQIIYLCEDLRKLSNSRNLVK